MPAASIPVAEAARLLDVPKEEVRELADARGRVPAAREEVLELRAAVSERLMLMEHLEHVARVEKDRTSEESGAPEPLKLGGLGNRTADPGRADAGVRAGGDKGQSGAGMDARGRVPETWPEADFARMPPRIARGL
jgi:hypothetical protein